MQVEENAIENAIVDLSTSLPTVQGEAIIVKRRAIFNEDGSIEAGEVIEEIGPHCNHITIEVLILALTDLTNLSRNAPTRIGISEEESSSSFCSGNITNRPDSGLMVTGYPTYTPATLIDNEYITYRALINPGASIRGINSIYLDVLGTVSSHEPIPVTTVLNLPSTCSQGTSEVLDITYKLIGIPPATNVNAGQQHYFKSFLRQMFMPTPALRPFNANSGYYGVPFKTIAPAAFRDISDNLAPLTYALFVQVYPLDLATTLTQLYKESLISLSASIDDATGVGRYLASYGGSNNYQRSAMSSINVFPDGVSPIGNTFKLKASANGPFQDIINIADMSGSVNYVGSGWTDSQLPSIVRTNITGTGAIGVATYNISVRKWFGSNNNGFGTCPEIMQGLQSCNSTTGVIMPQTLAGDATGQNVRYLTATPINSIFKFLPGGLKCAIHSIIDPTGIGIIDLLTQHHVAFNSLTTPALSVTDIRQISIVSDGSILVACANTGLWEISSDLLTVTQKTGVNAGVDFTKCYGVTIKSDGTVFAAFDGAICSSSDLSTWTHYNASTTPQFSFTGISNSLWSDIRSIKIDPLHVDDRLAIKRTTADTIVWWSVAGSNPTSNALSANLGSWTQNTADNCFEVDLLGNWYFYKSSTNRLIKAVFLATSGTNMTFTGGNADQFRVQRANVAGVEGVVSSRPMHGSDSTTNAIVFFTASISGTVYKLVQNTDFPSSVNGGINCGSCLAYSEDSNFCIQVQTGSNMFFGETQYYLQHLLGKDKATAAVADFNLVEAEMWRNYGWGGGAWSEGDYPGSKVVHAAVEAAVDGLTVSFANGVSGTSFINGEFFYTGVAKGIIKDNATSATFKVIGSPFPMIKNITDVSNVSNGLITVIPAATSGVLTDVPMTFSGEIHSASQPTHICGFPGECATNISYMTNSSQPQAWTTFGEQIIPASTDFSCSFKHNRLGYANVQNNPGWHGVNEFGFATFAFGTLPTTYENYQYNIRVDHLKVLTFRTGTTVRYTHPTPMLLNTKIGISRTSGLFSLWIDDINVFTYGVADNTQLIPLLGGKNSSGGVREAVITYTESRLLINIGLLANASGKFHAKYMRVPITPYTVSGVKNWSIKLNGGEVAGIQANSHTTPIAGVPTILSGAGQIWLHADEIGKTVAINMQQLQRLY